MAVMENKEIAGVLGPGWEKLRERWSEMEGLGAAIRLMYWDQSTYLPTSAAEIRGTHLAALSKLLHQTSTSDEMGEWISQVESKLAQLPADAPEIAMMREAKKEYENERLISTDLATRLSENASQSYNLWKKARAENDFKIVEEILKKSLDLSIEMATALKRPHHASLRDPLIDRADEGFTEAELRPMFAGLRQKLVPLLEKILARPALDHSCLHQHYPESEQKAFGEMLIRKLGYEFGRGRQDKTEHPFMIRIAGEDVRITTRYKENDLSDGLFSTIHEAGHALYELGIDPKFDGTPIGRGSSSGIHESQSRLWENLVGRSLAFWEYFFPLAQKAFPNQLGRTDLQTFYRAINRVERSLVRTDADEVTYNLHVMIRFDLESDLIAGKLKVKDLPEAWNARYRSDLGLTPPDAKSGVLQDVHWFADVIGGAFQGYTIGNILSAQIFAAAQQALPSLQTQFREGNFVPLREWLRKNLHQHGKRYEVPELIQRATGRGLQTNDYISYLETKYASLV
jgi:carboxypeptidase Taq